MVSLEREGGREGGTPFHLGLEGKKELRPAASLICRTGEESRRSSDGLHFLRDYNLVHSIK